MLTALSSSKFVELPVDEVSLTLYHGFVPEFSVARQHLLFDVRTVIKCVESRPKLKSRIAAYKNQERPFVDVREGFEKG